MKANAEKLPVEGKKQQSYKHAGVFFPRRPHLLSCTSCLLATAFYTAHFA